MVDEGVLGAEAHIPLRGREQQQQAARCCEQAAALGARWLAGVAHRRITERD
jgi:hypothetical protein